MKKFVFLGSLLLLMGWSAGCKKEGCTDPEANNYNDEAKKDDGSCTYTPDPLLVDDFTPPTGPDYTSTDLEGPAYFRLMTATSTDGLTFTTTGQVVTDQGNVPDLLYKDNLLYLYYTGWQMGSVQNATSCAVSADNGQTWAFNHCNFTGFGTNTKAVDPDVVLLDDGSFRMYATTAIGGQKCLVCYESSDGVNFSFVDTTAYSATDHIFDSNTFFFNGQWHMYAANSIDPVHWHLTSTDAIHFDVQGTYTFADGGDLHFISNGFVTGSSYRVMSAFNPGQHLKSFITTDGVNWNIESGYRLMFGGSTSEVSYLKDPAVIKLPNGTYLMVYTTSMI